MKTLKFHAPLLMILVLHFILSVTFSIVTPLGEAPDEPAHFGYAQFIARNGRLPATLEERREAGYRAAWPPLYHLLAAAPIVWVGDTPPTRLKSVGDTPRRLIPTNGQTIASFIHTADEAWPWQGIVLAWHLSRLISVTLTGLSVIVAYSIAWALTHRRWLATSSAALVAFMPQFLFSGAVVSDDTLLNLLSGLIILTLIIYTQQDTLPGFSKLVILGALLGLATVTKYNALPLWVIVPLWIVWRSRRDAWTQGRHVLSAMLAITLGATLTAGWWFIFIWRNFNQVDTLGPVRGSLAALAAGTSDAALRQLTGGGSSLSYLPEFSAWPIWIIRLFQSFWGRFGGGGTIAYPDWVYWMLAFVCGLAIIGLIRNRSRFTTYSSSQFIFFLLIPLFFIPLPFLRFILSGNIAETAQGRHLFPALSLIALAIVLGLSLLPIINNLLRFKLYVLPALLFACSLFGLSLIQTSYPPFIPLHTTAPTGQPKINLAEGVALQNFTVEHPKDGLLPITLVWQATAIPPEDYLIKLAVTDTAGNPIGGWLGHPIGGQYPTRAWDKGDTLQDTIRVPLLPKLSTVEATLSLNLLNSQGQPTGEPVILATQLPVTTNHEALPRHVASSSPPYTYRSTISVITPQAGPPPQLVTPTGQTFTPQQTIAGQIAHFIVEANWPTGNYQLPATNEQLSISNRPRKFEAPEMQHRLNANFAGAITLLGYDLPQQRVEPGQTFSITLHLQAQRTMGNNLAIFNHLLDAEAVQRGGEDRIPQNYYTTLLWVPGEVVSDRYDVPVNADAPPGVYWLDVGLYPTDTPSLTLPLIENGQPIERNGVSIGPIKVGGPPAGITVDKAAPQTVLNINFDNQITLVGYDLTAGANPTLTLYWQAETNLPNDYTVFVHLADAHGNLAGQADSPPAAGAYPTSLWDSAEIIVDLHRLPSLPAGRYTINIGLYQPESGRRLPAAGIAEGSVELTTIEVPPQD